MSLGFKSLFRELLYVAGALFIIHFNILKMDSGENMNLSSEYLNTERYETCIEMSPSNNVDMTFSEYSGNQLDTPLCEGVPSRLPGKIEHKYGCDMCSENFKTEEEFTVHRRISHCICESERQEGNGENSETSVTVNSALMHENETADSTVSQETETLNPDISARPSGRFYRCDECNNQFSRYSLLLAHKKKHEEGPPYFCGDCNVSFEDEDFWLDHKELGCKQPHQVHSKKVWKKAGSRKLKEKNFKCHYCPTSFKAISSRNDHERNLHKGLRPHSCGECGKTFYRKFNLTVHKKKHCSDRPYECKICNKKFKADFYVKMHMKIHSSSRPYMCEICGKVFKTLSVLESHQTFHTGECNFPCNLCSKSYRYRASLFIHMRSHTGHRPYACSYCSTSFMVKSHLTEHLRTHTGERPFQCSVCSICFSRLISLKKHMKSHIRAGCHVNLDKELYHAKLRAQITPRDTFNAEEETNYINNNTGVLSEPSKDQIVLYTDPPTDEKAEFVVITVSSVGDGQSCDYRISLAEECKISTVVNNENMTPSEEFNMQGHEFLVLDHSEAEEVSHVVDIAQDTDDSNQEKTNIAPDSYQSNDCDPPTETTIGASIVIDPLSGYECSLDRPSTDTELYYPDKTVAVNELCFLDKTSAGGQLWCPDRPSSDTGLCYPDKTVTNAGLYSEWMISQDTVACPVLESDNNIHRESVSDEQHHNVQVHNTDIQRQNESNMVESDVGIEYLEKTVDTNLNKTPEKKYEEILVDNNIQSILLTHQDIPVTADKNRASSEEELGTEFSLVHKEESQACRHSESLITKSPKTRRKPLRKCRYCDTSYRYLALLEAHEANHQVEINTCATNSETKCVNSDVDGGGQNDGGQNSHSHNYHHSTTRFENLPFKCEMCSFSFYFRSELRKHMKLHSSKYNFTCKLCHQVFQQESFLAKHHCGYTLSASVKSHDDVVNQIAPQNTKKYEGSCSYRCDLCGKVFHKAFALRVHKRSHTGERPFKCNICNKKLISATHLKVHKRIHTGERPYVCERCNKSFRLRSKFHCHLKACREIRVIRNCNIENAESNLEMWSYNAAHSESSNDSLHSTSKITNVRKHATVKRKSPSKMESNLMKDEIDFLERKENKSSVHSVPNDEFPCTSNALTDKVIYEEIKSIDSVNSTRRLPSKITAKSQMGRKKGREFLQCNHCTKMFRFRSLLQSHERSHTGEKPFPCLVCGKAFSKKSNLTVHSKIHTGERSYLCDYCGKHFMHKCGLDAHKRLHTKEQPFVCNVCGKRFRYKTSRYIHLKRHAGDKAFNCDLCSKAFVAKVDMEVHRRTHTGEKPYECGECGRKFGVRHHLTDHQRTHTGQNPYKCQLCDMRFARMGTLRFHMQKHNICKQ